MYENAYEKDGKTIYVNEAEDCFYFGDFSSAGFQSSPFWFLDAIMALHWEAPGLLDPSDLTLASPALQKSLEWIRNVKHLAIDWRYLLWLLTRTVDQNWWKLISGVEELTVVMNCWESADGGTHQRNRVLADPEPTVRFVGTAPGTLRSKAETEVLASVRTRLDKLETENPDHTFPRIQVKSLYSKWDDHNSNSSGSPQSLFYEQLKPWRIYFGVPEAS